MNRLVAVAAALTAFAGCISITVGPPTPGVNPPAPSVEDRIESALRPAAEKALTTGARVQSVIGVSRSGSHSQVGLHYRSEQAFRYEFRVVKDVVDAQSVVKASAMPAAEYRRVMAVVYSDILAAVDAGGGKRIEERCEDSTFVVRYQTTRSRGGKVIGTIRGRIGPADMTTQQPGESDSTILTVDLTEESDGK
jgi:hypothetical protein